MLSLEGGEEATSRLREYPTSWVYSALSFAVDFRNP